MPRFIDVDTLPEVLRKTYTEYAASFRYSYDEDAIVKIDCAESVLDNAEDDLRAAAVQYREACACGCEKEFHGNGKSCNVCWSDRCTFYQPVLWAVKS